MTQARMKIVLVAGARPNFMKVAPIIREFRKHEDVFDWRLVHTGQHYDHGMSDVFFEELGIPQPHFHMGAGGGSHAEQTARIMVAFEKYCEETKPDMVMVVGDVNSTLACSIVAKKLNIQVAHVEAGLRSGDMSMPEEINRMVTDSISDLFFVTEPSGVENLLREGHATERIHHVGHVMIDNLFYQLRQLDALDVTSFSTNVMKVTLQRYGVVTLHRPSNVDDKRNLGSIMSALASVAEAIPLVFTIHPRTEANMKKFGISTPPGIHCVPPLPYMEFLNLWRDAQMVLTDSGGLQEETTALGIPCLTMRESTERPITTTYGSNVIVGTNPCRIVDAARSAMEASRNATRRPPLWDGHASERIGQVLLEMRAAGERTVQLAN
jgi:UDP-N-acetylglucosamine 2-epimerase (non-hydrolysing)